MTQPLTQKQAIEQMTKLLGDFLGGKFGDPLNADTEDLGRMQEMRDQLDTHLGVCEAKALFRQQPWGERIQRQPNGRDRR